MRKLHPLILALILSCAHVSNVPNEPRRLPTWPDTQWTRTSIDCAVRKVHGAKLAREANKYNLRADDDLPLNEVIDTGTSTITIVISGRARTALASAWRHAVFFHVVPHVLDPDHKEWNRYHRPEYDAPAMVLDAAASACRLEARKKGLGP